MLSAKTVLRERERERERERALIELIGRQIEVLIQKTRFLSSSQANYPIHLLSSTPWRINKVLT